MNERLSPTTDHKILTLDMQSPSSLSQSRHPLTQSPAPPPAVSSSPPPPSYGSPLVRQSPPRRPHPRLLLLPHSPQREELLAQPSYGDKMAGSQIEEIESQNLIEIDALVTKMQGSFHESPMLLRREAGSEACCIFRVAQSLVDNNPKAYHPRIVSIGPYHHGAEHLNMVQEHKKVYLNDLLCRMNHPDALKEFLQAISQDADKIRKSYSENFVTKFDHIALVEMMVLDGVFIIELLSRVSKVVKREADDPIFNLDSLIISVLMDLLLLENQIPFFVLETLFSLSAPSRTSQLTLNMLVLKFFNVSAQRPRRVIKKISEDLRGVHLLDLFRKSFIMPSMRPVGKSVAGPYLKLPRSATKLRQVGIRFKVKTSESFLDIHYRNGAVHIPTVVIDDIARIFLLNFVAFEQCYQHCSKHMTEYLSFMGLLLITPRDAEYLCEKQILENHFGNHDEISNLFVNFSRDVAVHSRQSYLTTVYENLHRRRNNCFWKSGAELLDIRGPWKILSLLAAATLLVLTVLKVYYAAHPL